MKVDKKSLHKKKQLIICIHCYQVSATPQQLGYETHNFEGGMYIRESKGTPPKATTPKKEGLI